MKPAFSVLFFTVCAGAGTGLLVWLLLIQITHGWVLSELLDSRQVIVGGAIGLVLISLGLLSSTLHLANPKNAWKAFNRFRTSWLSREGVFSVVFYPIFLGYVAIVYLNGYQMNGLAALLGVLAIVIALVTVYCTGMIYASLKPIRQWHNNLTTPLYILFALMSGAILTLALQRGLHGDVSQLLLKICLTLIALTAAVKWLYFWFIGKPSGSTINSATGFTESKVRLLDAGHSADTFLTNEFGFNVEAAKLVTLRRVMAVLTFVLPFILMLLLMFVAAPEAAIWLLGVSVLSLFCGLFLERWLFFAEARHVVRLYHGDQRT